MSEPKLTGVVKSILHPGEYIAGAQCFKCRKFHYAYSNDRDEATTSATAKARACCEKDGAA